MMSHIGENLNLDTNDKHDVGLGDAEDNLLWKPQNIEVGWSVRIIFSVILKYSQDHNLTKLRLLINEKYGESLSSYNELHQWSVAHYDKFWSEVWDMVGIVASVQPDTSVDTTVSMDKIPKWFPGARLNYAENLLRSVPSYFVVNIFYCNFNSIKFRHPDDSKIALYYTSERKGADDVKTKTFGQLRERVRQLAASLKALGVGQGDRVVGYKIGRAHV